jgi:very-short-patch-repair endonuclease
MSLHQAKNLRQTMTEAERKLWYLLRGHRFKGVKFKRQKPIGPYIVDFVAVSKGLVIELDGSQHLRQTAHDTQRAAYLQELGFTVLRFWNDAVFTQTEDVLARIAWELDSPSPAPLGHPLPQAVEG